MKATLAGIRVLDFSQVAAGPTCTMMLADCGADVIKLESPGGDLGRQLGPPWQNGESVIFMALNRNKRSMVLDLKTVEGSAHARQLMAEADIVVESFRPGVMRRLGLDYEAAKALNPAVIYCSISAYGQHSPDASKAGVDGIVQAVSGLMSVCGAPGGEPSKVQAPVIDMATGILATLAVQNALLHRLQTGQGQWLDISMYESALQLQQTALASFFSTGEMPQPCASAAPYSAPNEAYATRDGWVMVAAYHPKRWAALCQLLDLPGMEHDPRFASSSERVAHRQALTELLAPVLRGRTTQEWLDLFDAADILAAPVADYAQVTQSAAFIQGNYIAAFQHHAAGAVQCLRPYGPVAGLNQGLGQAKPAPALGEHTQEILAELLAGRPLMAAPPVKQGAMWV